MKYDTSHLLYPTPNKIAYYQLTEDGNKWAERLLADHTLRLLS